MKTIVNKHRQRGYTLVEMLIAGVLGLVLLAGIGQLFVGSNQTFRFQRQLAVIQDNGRYALWLLKDEIERYGLQLGESEGPTMPNPDWWVDGGDDISDTFTVGYEVEDGSVDCAGSAISIADGAPDFDGDGRPELTNTYSVVDGELRCEGSGGAGPQPIIDNVESLQILYGIDTDDDQVPNQFVTADLVPNASRVVAMRLALLIASEMNTSVPKQDRSFQVADRNLSFDDQIPRRLFSVTVMMRNNLGA